MQFRSGKGLGGIGDGSANADISATAADIACHGCVNFVCRGRCALGPALEKGGRAHDLAALAVAALRHIMLDPGGMDSGANRIAAICHRFNGRDFFVLGCRNRRDTGTNSLAIQVHGTGAAKRCTTTEFRAVHLQRIAQRPKNRRAGVDVNGVVAAINIEGAHGVIALHK